LDTSLHFSTIPISLSDRTGLKFQGKAAFECMTGKGSADPHWLRKISAEKSAGKADDGWQDHALGRDTVGGICGWQISYL
jgi:hypothetical protein